MSNKGIAIPTPYEPTRSLGEPEGRSPSGVHLPFIRIVIIAGDLLIEVPVLVTLVRKRADELGDGIRVQAGACGATAGQMVGEAGPLCIRLPGEVDGAQGFAASGVTARALSGSAGTRTGSVSTDVTVG
ncbi:hypothetical protein [Streptomyces arboris]|uniref:hypothetical protein n=1 Tax=Streptomyces arboris TaxID=2600619 RepID=UPI003BF52F78